MGYGGASNGPATESSWSKIKNRLDTDPDFEEGETVIYDGPESDYRGEKREIENLVINPPKWMRLLHADDAPVVYKIDGEPIFAYEHHLEAAE